MIRLILDCLMVATCLGAIVLEIFHIWSFFEQRKLKKQIEKVKKDESKNN